MTAACFAEKYCRFSEKQAAVLPVFGSILASCDGYCRFFALRYGKKYLKMCLLCGQILYESHSIRI
jgi:hypothetical protein